jgi:hypothetical protein
MSNREDTTMDASAITLPEWAETYTDVLGRTQHRVTGPNGNFLVTRKDRFAPFEVWRSDSLNTIARDRDLLRAREHAHYYAHAGH